MAHTSWEILQALSFATSRIFVKFWIVISSQSKEHRSDMKQVYCALRAVGEGSSFMCIFLALPAKASVPVYALSCFLFVSQRHVFSHLVLCINSPFAHFLSHWIILISLHACMLFFPSVLKHTLQLGGSASLLFYHVLLLSVVKDLKGLLGLLSPNRLLYTIQFICVLF